MQFRFIEQRDDAGLGNSIFSRISGNSQLPSIDDIEAVLREYGSYSLLLQLVVRNCVRPYSAA